MQHQGWFVLKIYDWILCLFKSQFSIVCHVFLTECLTTNQKSYWGNCCFLGQCLEFLLCLLRHLSSWCVFQTCSRVLKPRVRVRGPSPESCGSSPSHESWRSSPSPRHESLKKFKRQKKTLYICQGSKLSEKNTWDIYGLVSHVPTNFPANIIRKWFEISQIFCNNVFNFVYKLMLRTQMIYLRFAQIEVVG